MTDEHPPRPGQQPVSGSAPGGATTDLAQRYGGPAPYRRRLLLAGSVLLAAAFGGWLAWTTWGHATAAVTSEMETYSIDGPDSATAVVVVTLRDGEVDAQCRLRALAEDHSVVGALTFSPDPGAGRRQSQTLRTERLATTVELLGCTAPGQPRPR